MVPMRACSDICESMQRRSLQRKWRQQAQSQAMVTIGRSTIFDAELATAGGWSFLLPERAGLLAPDIRRSDIRCAFGRLSDTA